jgi:hypothetical protein
MERERIILVDMKNPKSKYPSCRQAGKSKINQKSQIQILGFGNWDLFGSIGIIGHWDLSV